MSSVESALHDMASRLFGGIVTQPLLRAAADGVWPGEAWGAIEAAGLHLALLPEAAGGFGVPVAEALAILRAAGAAALPLPLGETMIAARLLASAGLTVPEGPLSLAATPAPVLTREGGGWRLVVRLPRVPWGRDASAIAVLITAGVPSVACVPREACHVTEEANLAGEPRDTLAIDTVIEAAGVAATALTCAELRAFGAAIRCQQIAGAVGRLCTLSVGYAQDRVQFGRAIGRFQAVQQSLALLAGQEAAALAAADLAAESIEPRIRPLAIAAAKARAGEAASLAASIAHQLFGAIGFTQEHSLHTLTRRLWSWRDEYGNEAAWSLELGRHLAGAGPDRLWAELTGL